ncbi:MAG: hypothetical protein LWX01_02765 [Deltaproteobacteria bacterium]|nr:hypothetical protein [Deltaproteobacteria bacterium]MDL1960615.1 hypothetical protein [Deltaproteobacteria bacterium]
MKMKLFAKVACISIFVIAVSAFVVAPIAKAASQEKIQAAIDAGVVWLVTQQDCDGSWGNSVARTGFAVVKLEDYAFEQELSPFDEAYVYSANVIAGLDYIFSRALNDDCGIHFESQDTYDTGIAMMAIAAGGDMTRTVIGGVLDGMTYGAVLEANVDYFENSQTTEGAWAYQCGNTLTDNSNSGYAVLGLRYAEAAGITIPGSIKDGLDEWIGLIQDPVDGDVDDGGSWYRTDWPWVNLLKTGNLLFQMAFVDDTTATVRVQDAIDYIVRHWNDLNDDPGWKPDNYQAMYCLMKGFESLGIWIFHIRYRQQAPSRLFVIQLLPLV